jgi:tellurite resistance-related uncharacterized protein
LPDGLTCYKRTKTFDEQSIPAGLLRDHSTKPGVWGRVVVESGRLLLHFEDDGEQVEVTHERDAVLKPERSHRVELLGPVRFLVEFHRTATD